MPDLHSVYTHPLESTQKLFPFLKLVQSDCSPKFDKENPTNLNRMSLLLRLSMQVFIFSLLKNFLKAVIVHP